MKKYPKMKPSGVEWIGEVPEGWEVKKIKRLSPVKRGASPRPIDDQKYFDEAGEFSWVRIADVTASEKYLEITTERLSALGSSLSVKRFPGDFFLSIAGTVGKPIIAKIKCCIHDGFVWFPLLDVQPEFLYYIFKTGLPYQGLGKWGTQLNLNTETVGDIELPLPNKDEISTIITYLDRKTAQIDQSIAEKQGLIELFREERQAIINHAVTKGIRPGVKMKDSGVAWIGEVPEGWAVKKLKYVLASLNSKRIPLSSEVRGGMTKREYDYYGASGVIDKVEDFLFDETLILVGEDGANLLSRSSPLAFLAKGKYWVNNHAHILKPKKGSLEYFVHQLELNDFTIFVTGSAQPKLTQENLFNIFLLCPPVEEQSAIAEYLNQKTTQIEQAILGIQQEIALLQEYRQALIFEAVTGKVDVRGKEKLA